IATRRLPIRRRPGNTLTCTIDLRSQSAAEKAALEKCGEDAQLACWVNRGFCALALGSDKSCWGIGYSHGNGANTDKAKSEALADLPKPDERRAHCGVSEFGR